MHRKPSRGAGFPIQPATVAQFGKTGIGHRPANGAQVDGPFHLMQENMGLIVHNTPTNPRIIANKPEQSIPEMIQPAPSPPLSTHSQGREGASACGRIPGGSVWMVEQKD